MYGTTIIWIYLAGSLQECVLHLLQEQAEDSDDD